ncbi:hypothetical protein BDR06DRAFT_975152 [Suillus hirtellus]|nr:hypothetical protein BDR06DRAFT_975152 [Suillus hirtellus]
MFPRYKRGSRCAVGLDIHFGPPNAVSYLEKAVASHLRIYFPVTEDRSWAFTSYSSEPLLSCIAAILLQGTSRSLVDALEVLKAKVDDGMVGPSKQDNDMYALINLSIGTISDIHFNGSEDAKLIRCQKVLVFNLLEYLFGDEFRSKTGEKAKTAFQHAYVIFSHWVPMETSSRRKIPS